MVDSSQVDSSQVDSSQVDSSNSAASMLDEPVFLVGAERSGTTLFRLMLDSHPQVTWLFEFEYAVDMMAGSHKFPQLDQYYAWLDTHRIFRMSGMQIDSTLTYPELMKSFLRQGQTRFNKPVIGATVHRHFDQLLEIWPKARFIHIVRDPRDVSRSCMVRGWAGNVWIGVGLWTEAEALWAQLSNRIPEDRRIDIFYKDLVANNRETLERVCDFLGVAYSPKMLDYVRATDFTIPDPKLIAGWRHKLSEREVQLVEARAGEQMVGLGFALSGLPRVQPSVFELVYLHVQNRWARFAFRVKRYGVRLFLADFVTRRLKLRALNRTYRLEMNNVESAGLKKSW